MSAWPDKARARTRPQPEQRERLLADEHEICLQQAMRIARLGLWDYHIERQSVGSNAQTALMLGYQPERFRETRAAFVARLHPDDRAHMLETFYRYLRGEASHYECEYRMRTRSGAWRRFRATGEIVERGADGRPLRLVGTYLDISDTPRPQTQPDSALAETIKTQLAALEKHLVHLEDSPVRRASAQYLLGQIRHALQTPPPPPEINSATVAALSQRQRQVWQYIANGYSTRAIAEALCISPKTVETHRGQLMRRLALFDIASLTREAVRQGIISL